MIGLAWDDQPEHDNYIIKLREALERRNVILSVYKNEDQFVEKLFDKKWDFIVTDLLKSMRPDASIDDDKLHGEKVGISLIKAITQSDIDCPIYCVTHAPEEAANYLKDYPRILIRPKKLFAPWVAEDIIRELKKQGRFINRSTVFLIYAAETNTVYEDVANWLHTIGAQVERVGPGRLKDHLSQGLVDNITPCGSIIAICTADDLWSADGSYHPRQNVMVEIGMALALYRGHERLIIMQQRASGDGPLAVLPTDLDGLLTIPFTPQKVSEAFPLVSRALRERGFPSQS